MAKPSIGKLAVERALVSQEHLDLCVEYQRALGSNRDAPAKLLGEILVEKGLLKPEQVDDLLDQQSQLSGERPAVKPEEAPPPPAEEPGPAPHQPEPARRPRPARWRPLYTRLAVGAGGVLAVVLAVVLLLRPRSGPEATLAAYLASCREGSGGPDRSLAVGDLGLAVRTFAVTAHAPRLRLDYARELAAHAPKLTANTWAAFLKTGALSPTKARTLRLAVPMLHTNVRPKDVGSLTLVVQRIRCSAVFRTKGETLFTPGSLNCTLMRVETPSWRSPWKVADCTPGPSR